MSEGAFIIAYECVVCKPCVPLQHNGLVPLFTWLPYVAAFLFLCPLCATCVPNGCLQCAALCAVCMLYVNGVADRFLGKGTFGPLPKYCLFASTTCRQCVSLADRVYMWYTVLPVCVQCLRVYCLQTILG